MIDIKEVTEKQCERCGKVFRKMASESRRYFRVRRFCSIRCSGTLIVKGESLPKHIHDGMEESYKRQINQMQKGERSFNWRGGKSYGFKKKVVLVRDNYTCVMCGHREPWIMEVDHVKRKKDYPELANEVSNLVTLCPNCHRRKTNREMIEHGQNPFKQVRGF